MRRFERSSHCLAPVPTVHAAAAWFCRLHQNHGNSLDYLSMHGPELRDGLAGFIFEDTGIVPALRGQGCSTFSPGRLEGG